MLQAVFALRSRVHLNAIRSGTRVVSAAVIGFVWLLLALPRFAAGQDADALLFIAHPDSGQEATAADPIPVAANRAVFDVRVSDAGDAAKAGWQTTLALDACEFEQPAEDDIELGDMFPGAVPVLTIQPVQSNLLRLRIGQVLLNGTVTEASGRLATIHLVRKAARSCPNGGSGTSTGPSPVTFAASPSTQWSAPGGVKLSFSTHTGYIAGRISAVRLSRLVATPGAFPAPLLGLIVLVLAAVAGLLRHRRSRS